MDFLLQEVLHFWIAFRYSYILHHHFTTFFIKKYRTGTF